MKVVVLVFQSWLVGFVVLVCQFVLVSFVVLVCQFVSNRLRKLMY